MLYMTNNKDYDLLKGIKQYTALLLLVPKRPVMSCSTVMNIV